MGKPAYLGLIILDLSKTFGINILKKKMVKNQIFDTSTGTVLSFTSETKVFTKVFQKV